MKQKKQRKYYSARSSESTFVTKLLKVSVFQFKKQSQLKSDI